MESDDDEPDSTEYRALATAGLEAVTVTFTRDTANRLRSLIDRGMPPDREQRRYVYDALAEVLVGLGDISAAVSLLQESLAFRDRIWTETLQIHAYSTAQAIQLQEARRQAEEERWRREELASTISQVERLNSENEALVRQLRQQTILLERLSREDSLTGLLNRRAFNERLTLELAEARTLGIPVTTCFVDLDNFKHINDEFSHAIGDMVLQTVARLLAQCASEGGAVGRYGGEEFVLVLPGVESADARAIGERILEAINRFAWETIAPGLTVTLCAGIWTAAGEMSPAVMISQADRLLYDAKRAGKNQIQVGSA
jgi:diguanylate cyclase (GGDEF)-like protein